MIWVAIVEAVVIVAVVVLMVAMCIVALAAYMVLDRHGIEGDQLDREIKDARGFIIDKWFGKRTR